MNNAIDFENQVLPIEDYPLPSRLSDFDDILAARNYLVTEPICNLLYGGEVRDLLEIRVSENNTVILEKCFNKVYRTPLPKLKALYRDHKKQKSRQD